MDLKTVIAEKDSKIIQLERTVKEMKEAQFCDDLIQLDESIPLNDDDELINEGNIVASHSILQNFQIFSSIINFQVPKIH